MRRLALSAAAAAVLVAACGSGDGGSAAPSPSCDEPTTADGGSVTLRGNASFAFEPGGEITVPAGQVAFTLVNDSPAPHTLVIDGVPFKLSTPGEGDECSGAVELAAGTYEYYCDIPGHRQSGMKGTLIVE